MRKFSDICRHTSSFSECVFHHLSEVFSFQLGFAELGLTDHFVLSLARFSQRRPHQVQVYKTSWPVEDPFGNDLDLFVRDAATGLYDWYALQAKVMSYTGEFSDLKRKKTGKKAKEFEQWYKLVLHERVFGSQAFYLLYVGEPSSGLPAIPATQADCAGGLHAEDFGLSLVKAQDIMSIMTTANNSKPLSFSSVFPHATMPLRSLFCCPRTTPVGPQFSQNDILHPAYQQVYARRKDEDPYRGLSQTDNVLPAGFAPVRILIDPNPAQPASAEAE